MSGYPGFRGNQVPGATRPDVEMGTYAGSTAQQGQAQGYAYGGGGNPTAPPVSNYANYAGASAYGQPQKPQAAPMYGYGGQQPGGGYAAPPVHVPPPQPVPPQSAYLSEMEMSVRHGFIRKVYGILFCQLLLTFGIVVVFSYIPAVQDYAMNNTWLMGVGIAAVFAILIVMTCCPGDIIHKFPMNLVLLLVLSIFEGLALGTIAATYACDKTEYNVQEQKYFCVNTDDGTLNGRWAVLLAIGITLVVVVALSIFACQTRFDFTGYGPYLLMALVVFLVFFFIAGLWLRFNKIYNLVYACIGVLIFSALLIYNTQTVVGGKNRKYTLGPDEYILGALMIYLDIINMFMFILSIIGFTR